MTALDTLVRARDFFEREGRGDWHLDLCLLDGGAEALELSHAGLGIVLRDGEPAALPWFVFDAVRIGEPSALDHAIENPREILAPDEGQYRIDPVRREVL